MPAIAMVPSGTAQVIALIPDERGMRAVQCEAPAGIPLPRREVAAALRLMADALERQAQEVDAGA